MVKLRRPMILMGTAALIVLGTTACGSSVPEATRVVSDDAGNSSSTSSISSTTYVTPSTPVTGPTALNPPTTIVQYPNPYAPSYDTLESLAADASFVVLAKVEPEIPTNPPGYPLDDYLLLGGQDGPDIGISVQEFQAAHLTVGNSYVFFYAFDPVDKTDCIVGGVRGVLAYDPSTQTVTRIDNNAASQIPQQQTLTQFKAALTSAENVIEGGTEVGNLPPMCLPAATGLS
jgi:hypothetical protein